MSPIDNECLIRVVAPHFVAGVVLVNGRIVEAAPILKWSIGRCFRGFRDYCVGRKNWKVEMLHTAHCITA